ncbi:uncharacterized protein dpr13 isoform X1 [Drosophila pseudoobscura]|uniref:Uncharacterized protein dpr13 isoform X1 n=1 Tax=Drosophila pseudoobscura pseudoobscura TaxID=46245 RepID=A0A6I8V5F5_DROPS|nr:uncharacterized protein LOC6898365 isoform X1 [Drosophila pseudoobscura]
MPASSGLYRITSGRVLDRMQKPAALIFIACIAACGVCDHTAIATAMDGAGTEAEAASTMAPQSTAAAAAAAARSGHSAQPSQRHINQNLIMSPVSAAALTAPYPSYSRADYEGESDPEPVPVPEPYAQGPVGASGSSITSFDSTNLIDDKHQSQGQGPHASPEQHPQQHLQQHSRIQAKDTAGPYPIPMAGHRSEPAENNLEATNGIDGVESVFGSPMYFGTENSTVVTTQIGATAHVPCTVHHIGEGVVSWIRKKDYHLLTVGLTTYSSDERFSATHLKHSEDWTLQIKFVQLRDAGVYECQVSTHPPTSIFLHLSVVEARAEISGPPIRYLTPGSTLRLQCRVVQNTEASEYIFWYHDNRMINYDIDRGINVSTEPDFQSSELTIQRTRREHSGNFTCVASNTQPASVLVHIFKGDNPAAMYHGHVGGSTKTMQSQLHMIMIIIATGYRIFHTSVYMKIS